jgi:hypothetical protein
MMAAGILECRKPNAVDDPAVSELNVLLLNPPVIEFTPRDRKAKLV